MKRGLTLLALALFGAGLVHAQDTWTFSSSTDTITHPLGWVFAVEVNDHELTVTECLAAPDGDVLPLADPVDDGYTIVSLYSPYWEWYSGLLAGFEGAATSLTLPDTLVTIGDCAFDSYPGFTGPLVIPNSVKTIGWYAFIDCGFTGPLTLGSSLEIIGGGAFEWCSGFTGPLVIPDSVTYIGGGAFDGCSGFTGSLVIPDSVTEIGDGAFAWCSGFTGSLVIPDSVTYIEGWTFGGCSGFDETLTISSSVKAIGHNAFSLCGFTGSLVIPDSVTYIGGWAFDVCTGFDGTLTIGNSVTEIGNFAFAVNGFTEVRTPSTGVTFGEGVFLAMHYLTAVYYSGAHPDDVGDNFYTSDWEDSPLVVSYVTAANAHLWDDYVTTAGGGKFSEVGEGMWQDKPIRIYVPTPPTPQGVRVDTIAVDASGDVTLTWAAVTGTVTVHATSDLSNPFPGPDWKLFPGNAAGATLTRTELESQGLPTNKLFFRVTAVE